MFLDPIGELEPDEQEACRRSDLALPGGLAPRVLRYARGEMHALSDDGQRALLAAVEAIEGR